MVRITPAYAGKTDAIKAAEHGIGITPAYAGKTRVFNIISNVFQDHPRLRGKDCFSRKEQVLYQGSPPLTRERHNINFFISYLSGITPAYAGKTISHLYLIIKYLDHPRLRGKDQSTSSSWFAPQGSPPLTRERLI